MTEVISRKEAKEKGLQFYFTGKPCKRGHIVRRYACSNNCVTCTNERSAVWHINNLTKARQATRKSQRRNYWQNPERAREKARQWAASNREKVSATYHKWAAANPEALKINGRNRRARERGAEGSHTTVDVKALCMMQRGKCAYCRRSIRRSFHVDHIYPLSRGGRNDVANLQLLCAPCNLSKYNHDPVEFAQSLGLLL